MEKTAASIYRVTVNTNPPQQSLPLGGRKQVGFGMVGGGGGEKGDPKGSTIVILQTGVKTVKERGIQTGKNLKTVGGRKIGCTSGELIEPESGGEGRKTTFEITTSEPVIGKLTGTKQAEKGMTKIELSV